MTRFTLHHGDCVTILPTLPEASVDLVLTDPPYGVSYRDRSGRTVANDDTVDFLAPAFAEVARLMKPDTLCISFYGWNQVDHFMAAWRAAGLSPVGHIVWEKGYSSRVGFLEARHEQAYLLAKGRPARPEQPLPDVLRWKYSGNPLHLTQKAVEILKPLIESFTAPGAVVLDPFAGSGSAGAACAMTRRAFIGVELDANHYSTALDRLTKLYPPNRGRPRLAA